MRPGVAAATLLPLPPHAQLKPLLGNHFLKMSSRLEVAPLQSLGFTWRGHTVLVCGLQFIDGEQHHLDGSDEDASQAAIKYHVEQKDLNCGENRQTWG